jgi:hypothetical protein
MVRDDCPTTIPESSINSRFACLPFRLCHHYCAVRNFLYYQVYQASIFVIAFDSRERSYSSMPRIIPNYFTTEQRSPKEYSCDHRCACASRHSPYQRARLARTFVRLSLRRARSAELTTKSGETALDRLASRPLALGRLRTRRDLRSIDTQHDNRPPSLPSTCLSNLGRYFFWTRVVIRVVAEVQ